MIIQNLKLEFKKIIQEKKVFFPLIIALLINIFLWFLFYFKFKGSSEPIPLHYNIYFGVDLLGDWKEIFKIPIVGLIIFILNFFVSFLIYEKEKILSYFLTFSSLLIQVILLLASFLIINL